MVAVRWIITKLATLTVSSRKNARVRSAVIERTSDGVRTKSLKRDQFWLERGVMARSISGVAARVKRLLHET
ncbi:hypothetical protein GCM10017620_10070 [Brevundimonas intermedia]|uniref:Secreted protein n=1 Tax=Brevundimonas intermedia TaxID=74315 RepID=A0ABQ5T5K1_9CAUL|nr:hypothetical protein GCM10017620_10070 [Brevundimonas intermedia]